MNKIQLLCTGLFALLIQQTSYTQLSGDHAFMIGDYVEIGVHGDGYEGAPLDVAIPTHYRGGVEKLGFMANPAEDGWIDYNGDFYLPGAPESGFGLQLNDVNYGNNAVGLNEIPGEITSYSETVDSIVVEWLGMVDSVEFYITYELKKDQHFYRTTMSVDNIGSETFDSAYFYRTLDPDNNMDIGWGFATTNKIVSQAEMADDSVIVSATQLGMWTSEMIFEAYGENWRGFIGGFYNRNAYNMWNGYGGLITTEDVTVYADQAVGISYKIGALAPSRASSEEFSYVTAFKSGLDYSVAVEEPDTDGLTENENLAYRIYPNPSTDHLIQIQIEGSFNYSVTDLKGSLISNGQGNGLTQLDFNHLDKGIYFIEIEQENITAIEKLILR